MTGRARTLASVTNVALAFLIAGCAAKAAPATPAGAQAASPSSVEQLRRDLRSIFTTGDVDHAFWGVAVRSLKTDEVLYSLNANRMQTPASNIHIGISFAWASRSGVRPQRTNS